MNLADYAPLVRQMVRRYGLHYDAAESESRVWGALWRAAETWRPDCGASFETWARWYAQGALAHAKGVAARRRHIQLLGDVDVASAQSTPDPAPRWLGPAIKALPPRYAEAVSLVFGQDLTYVDAGRQMGITGEAVRQLIVKATTQLRKAAPTPEKKLDAQLATSHS